MEVMAFLKGAGRLGPFVSEIAVESATPSLLTSAPATSTICEHRQLLSRFSPGVAG